jgi:hypothetical protein
MYLDSHTQLMFLQLLLERETCAHRQGCSFEAIAARGREREDKNEYEGFFFFPLKKRLVFVNFYFYFYLFLLIKKTHDFSSRSLSSVKNNDDFSLFSFHNLSYFNHYFFLFFFFSERLLYVSLQLN